MRRALFLDRDGTLIADKHYLADPAGVELLPGAAEGLCRARDLGFRLYLLSNQSGIGRGYYTMDDALAVNVRMEELLGLSRPVFDGVCMAPETPDQPAVYRKPSPRYILETIARDGLEPTGCFMIGDKLDDALAGIHAGIAPVLLLTGKIKDPASVPEISAHKIPLFSDLAAFVATLS